MEDHALLEAKHTDPAPVKIGCVSEPFGLDGVLALGGGDRRRARGQTEAVENFPSRVGRMNGGEDAQAFFAAGTFEYVQGPHALHQFSPGIVSPMSRGGNSWGAGRGFFGGGVCECPTGGIGGRGRFHGSLVGYDERPPFCGRCEDAGIAHQVCFGSGHNGGEFFQQFEGSQNNVRGPISPGPLETRVPVRRRAVPAVRWQWVAGRNIGTDARAASCLRRERKYWHAD